jgi:NDP-sugar pyrophosphorylase family protein
MAGKGTRFQKALFKVSKPLISVSNKPMVVTACCSFPGASKWIFLPRAIDMVKHPIKEALQKYFPNKSIVIPVENETSGQVATCLLARNELDPSDHVLIASCDYKTIFDQEEWSKMVKDNSIDAVIWTCRLGASLTKNPKAFAYCETSEDGRTVTKIVEKNTISNDPGKDPLVVGTFWFRRAEDLINMAEEVIRLNINVNNEHYLGNGMNLMINAGKKIVIFDVKQWISFGDPFELDVYYYWEDYFYSKGVLHQFN